MSVFGLIGPLEYLPDSGLVLMVGFAAFCGDNWFIDGVELAKLLVKESRWLHSVRLLQVDVGEVLHSGLSVVW